MAGRVEREVPGLVAVNLAVGSLDDGLERLTGRFGNQDVEREVEVVVVALVKAVGSDDLLGNRERGGLLERDPAIVAEEDVDRLATPPRVDDRGGSGGGVTALGGVKLVDTGELTRALPHNEVAGLIGRDAARDSLDNAAREGDNARAPRCRATLKLVPRVAVVIGR